MKLTALCLLSLGLLCGCSSHYDITTMDGQHYTTRDAPDFRTGKYTFDDTDGKTHTVSLFNVKTLRQR